MAYSKQSWNDNDPTTPLSAARLNHLETQADAALAQVIADIKTPGTNLYAAVDSAFATNSEVGTVTASQFFNYGVRPVIRYTGSVWPARNVSVPSGYAGNVDYDSADFTGVPSPSDMLANDRWIRQTT